MDVCARCGNTHTTTRRGKTVPACSGHISSGERKGQPCRQCPSRGQAVCRSHGGRTPQALAAAAQRQQRTDALKLMATLGEPVDDGRDYADVIAERVAVRRGHVAWLLTRVQALDPDALAWGRTKTTRGDVVVGTGNQAQLETAETDTDEAKPSIWYAMYVDAARDLERLCIDAIRVGVEVRRQQMDERTAEVWIRMLDGIVTALGHDPNNPETAEIVARHLELVA